MKKIVLILTCALFLILISCKKIEGKGGSSTIKGSIYVVKKNGAGSIISEYLAPKEDVYIIYGSNEVSFDDDVKTSHDGTFKFTGLEKGKYTIFVYENCISCASGKQVKLYPVNINKNKSTIDLGTITVIK